MEITTTTRVDVTWHQAASLIDSGFAKSTNRHGEWRAWFLCGHILVVEVSGPDVNWVTGDHRQWSPADRPQLHWPGKALQPPGSDSWEFIISKHLFITDPLCLWDFLKWTGVVTCLLDRKWGREQQAWAYNESLGKIHNGVQSKAPGEFQGRQSHPKLKFLLSTFRWKRRQKFEDVNT